MGGQGHLNRQVLCGLLVEGPVGAAPGIQRLPQYAAPTPQPLHPPAAAPACRPQSWSSAPRPRPATPAGGTGSAQGGAESRMAARNKPGLLRRQCGLPGPARALASPPALLPASHRRRQANGGPTWVQAKIQGMARSEVTSGVALRRVGRDPMFRLPSSSCSGGGTQWAGRVGQPQDVQHPQPMPGAPSPSGGRACAASTASALPEGCCGSSWRDASACEPCGAAAAEERAHADHTNSPVPPVAWPSGSRR